MSDLPDKNYTVRVAAHELRELARINPELDLRFLIRPKGNAFELWDRKEQVLIDYFDTERQAIEAMKIEKRATGKIKTPD